MTTAASLPERPLLAPWYRRVEDGGRLVFEHAGRAVVFEGAAVRRLLPALLPLLDGTRTVDGLVEALGRPVAPAVEHALRLLADRGVLTDGPAPGGAAGAVETAEHLAAGSAAASPALVLERLRAVVVGVVGRSAIAGEVARMLACGGVRVARREAPVLGAADVLAVAAAAPDEPDLLAAVNREAISLGAAWLPVLATAGGAIAVGPLVLAGRTACLVCRGPMSLRPHEPSPGRAAAAAAVAAEHALRWAALADPRLPGVQHILEPADGALALRAEPVRRVPRCPACSDARVRANSLPWHEAA